MMVGGDGILKGGGRGRKGKRRWWWKQGEKTFTRKPVQRRRRRSMIMKFEAKREEGEVDCEIRYDSFLVCAYF